MITLVSMLEKVFLLNDNISDNRYNYKALGIQIIYEIKSGFGSNGVIYIYIYIFFFFHNCNIYFFSNSNEFNSFLSFLLLFFILNYL